MIRNGKLIVESVEAKGATTLEEPRENHRARIKPSLFTYP